MTLAAYGAVAELAESAALELLLQEEIFCEVVILSQLSPFCLEPLLDSVERTGRLVVCEEGTRTAGWGAEVVAEVASEAFPLLRAAPQRVAARDLPLASSKTLEDASLPQVADIVAAAQGIAATHSYPRT